VNILQRIAKLCRESSRERILGNVAGEEKEKGQQRKNHPNTTKTHSVINWLSHPNSKGRVPVRKLSSRELARKKKETVNQREGGGER